MENEREKLHDLIERFDTAMLVTHGTRDGSTGQGGPFHTRPMQIAKLEDDLGIWFLTDSSSPKVREIEDRADVQLVFQDNKGFVAVTGVATVSKDRAKLDELWKPEFEAWFPNGKDDPNLTLVHVQGREAEYWDQSGKNRLKYAAQVVKAVATGTRPQMDESQHGKARL